MMPYQPVWRDGKTVGSSRRDGEGRYGAIAGYLEGLDRFRALDVGAHAGYFSLRLADEFEADVTAVDDAEQLRETAARPDVRGVTFIHKRIGADDLAGLGHFDVALCLSVLHHVPWWRQMLTVLSAQSDILFVEVPDPREVLPTAVAHFPEVSAVVGMLGGKKIYSCPGFDERYSRPMYVIDRR
ncbi:class I SAM-dependent methyltransferase [Rhodococcus qingshengii]|uniref:class I SAM-dependent methyltransferase n=1 Tax=Rhodococcus qingshengii TaxID=334542 RepID=UPI0035E3A868